MDVPCFLLEPTNRYQRFARRYSFENSAAPKCPLFSWHSVVVPLGIDVIEDHNQAIVYCDGAIPVAMLDGVHFPERCQCGYVFAQEDHRQVGHHVIMRDAASGLELPLRDAPAGAMWHAPWMLGFHEHNRANDPKGSLIVRLPNRIDWNVDGPASNGPGWTRTGVPPHVTAEPSILAGDYHGFLRAGVLVPV